MSENSSRKLASVNVSPNLKIKDLDFCELCSQTTKYGALSFYMFSTADQRQSSKNMVFVEIDSNYLFITSSSPKDFLVIKCMAANFLSVDDLVSAQCLLALHQHYDEIKQNKSLTEEIVAPLHKLHLSEQEFKIKLKKLTNIIRQVKKGEVETVEISDGNIATHAPKDLTTTEISELADMYDSLPMHETRTSVSLTITDNCKIILNNEEQDSQ